MADHINGINIGDAEDVFVASNRIIGVGSGHDVVTGSTGFIGDQGDIYTILSPVNGTIAISLTGLSQDLDIYLYDQAREEVDSSWRLGNANEIIYFELTANSLYYVEVHPVAGGSNYTLTLDLPVPVPLPSELGNKDVVNGFDIGDAGYNKITANEITLNNIGDGIVSGSTGHYTDSRDWYFFTPVESGEVSIKLTGLDGDLDFALYDQSNNIIDYSDNSGSNDEIIRFTAFGGQSYIIEIDNLEQGSDYILLIDSDASSPLPGIDSVNGRFSQDAGSTQDEALHMGWTREGTGYVSGSTGFGGDQSDWFTFKSPNYGRAEFTLTSNVADTDLTIFDESGRPIDLQKFSSGFTTTYTYWVDPGEMYYFSVDAQNGSQSYAVEVVLPRYRPEAFPVPVTPRSLSNGTTAEYGRNPGFALLNQDGSVAIWASSTSGGINGNVPGQSMSDVVQIYSNTTGFAALKSDGSVALWGDYQLIMSASLVSDQFESDVVALFSNRYTFVALKADGSVVSLGELPNWGVPLPTGLDSGVVQIFSSNNAFAALKSDGSVVSWGTVDTTYIPLDSEKIAQSVGSDVVEIIPADNAFAALKSDGSVIAWGNIYKGGDSSNVASKLDGGVEKVYTNGKAYAALKDDGSVVRWGDIGTPFLAKDIDAMLSSGVVDIHYNNEAFAALKEDGSVVAWGNYSYGGGFNNDVAQKLLSGVVSIQSFEGGFAAFKEDGAVVAWGSYLQQKAPDIEEMLSGGIVKILENYAAISALKSDGSVVTSITIEDIDQAEALSKEVLEIYAGDTDFFALKADGSVVTLGHNIHAEDMSDRLIAELSSDVTDVFTSGGNFIAQKSDGTLVIWGNSVFYNEYGYVEYEPMNPGLAEIATPFSNNFYVNGTESADDISGFPGNNFINALDGNDSIWGGPVNDVIDGGAGNDTLFLYGQPDEYVLSGSVLSGIEGDDTLSALEFVGFGFALNSSNHEIVVELADLQDTDSTDAIKTFAGQLYRIAVATYSDTHGLPPDLSQAMLSFKAFYSLAVGLERVDAGTDVADKLLGQNTRDLLYGNKGNDTITGASGIDFLIGGSGDDVFRFVTAGDSTLSAYDSIHDYSSGDTLRFDGIVGITAQREGFSWAGSVSATVTNIMNTISIEDQSVFFTDGSDGYVYIKGDGRGIDFNGTLIKLDDYSETPRLTDEMGVPVMTQAQIDLIEMYVIILGRAPNQSGLDFWNGIVANGQSFEYVAKEMWDSPGARDFYPNTMSIEEKVTTVYTNVLNREPLSEGLNFWIDRWEDIGPVATMLEMINALTSNNSSDPRALADKTLFQNKINLGGYLALSVASNDVVLARSVYEYLNDGHSLEDTIAYIDGQLGVLGQGGITDISVL